MHVKTALLEEYALKRVAPTEAVRLETHLLVCELCRTQLSQAEEFVEAIRTVLGSQRQIPPRRHSSPPETSDRRSIRIAPPAAKVAIAKRAALGRC
jgi:hypothetical protein